MINSSNDRNDEISMKIAYQSAFFSIVDMILADIKIQERLEKHILRLQLLLTDIPHFVKRWIKDTPFAFL